MNDASERSEVGGATRAATATLQGSPRGDAPRSRNDSYPRAVSRRRPRDGAGDGHLPRSRGHRHACAGNPPRSRADGRSDGVGVHRLSAGLRIVRSADRALGGSRRHAIRDGAHRDLVVGVDRGHGRRVQLSRHARGAVPVRRRRGRRVALCGADVLTLDSAQRARTRAGHFLRRRAPGRRTDACRHRRRRPARQRMARHAQRDVVARRVRRLWPGGARVGRGVAVLVSKRPVATSGGERRGARRDRGGSAARVGAPERPRVLGNTDSQPEHDGAERHVHPELHDFLFLHHVAADLSAGATWVQYFRHGVLRRSAAAGQHAG